MSSGDYLVGVALLAVLACSAALTAVEITRAVLPGRRGSPVRVAELVCGIAVVIVVAELLGSVGEFRRWPLVAAMAAVAVGARLLGRRRRSGTAWLEDDPPRSGGATAWIAALVVAALASRALEAAGQAWHTGVLSYDTLWYHLPFAVQFAQSGSLTGLHYVGNDPTTFYPANGELVHAIAMLLFHSDFLSPIVNVCWLVLALLAGWCVGRPSGVAPATMLATCLVAFLPVMGGAQAGSAGTDVVVLALLVSAVALVVNFRRAPAALAIAALAAGLAAGTKLDAWATVVALGAVAVALCGRPRRGVASLWVGGVVVGSAFWYGRNLADVGNPFPWFGSTAPPVDCGTTSVAHYLIRPGFVTAHLLPRLPVALGARWWVVVGLAAAGIVAALGSRGRILPALGVVALVSAAAYLATPTTAGGHEGSCLSYNTRFATPALALGLILLPLAASARRHGPLFSTIALAIAAALNIRPSQSVSALAGAGLAVAVVGFAARSGRRRLAAPAVAAGAVVAALAVAVGFHELHAYQRGRYTDATFSDPIAPIANRLRDVHAARIAVLGISESYPLYGADLSNRIGYPARRKGARFFTYSSCRSWLDALGAGRYDYVVTSRQGTTPQPAAAWTLRDPGARRLAAGAGIPNRGSRFTWELFRLDRNRRVDSARACA